jgi:hypothetical protein
MYETKSGREYHPGTAIAGGNSMSICMVRDFFFSFFLSFFLTLTQKKNHQ